MPAGFALSIHQDAQQSPLFPPAPQPAVGSAQAPPEPLTAPLHPGKPHGPHGATRDGRRDPRLERGVGLPVPTAGSGDGTGQGSRGRCWAGSTERLDGRCQGHGLTCCQIPPHSRAPHPHPHQPKQSGGGW